VSAVRKLRRYTALARLEDSEGERKEFFLFSIWADHWLAFVPRAVCHAAPVYGPAGPIYCLVLDST
jgi:hypothetical protein